MGEELTHDVQMSRWSFN